MTSLWAWFTGAPSEPAAAEEAAGQEEPDSLHAPSSGCDPTEDWVLLQKDAVSGSENSNSGSETDGDSDGDAPPNSGFTVPLELVFVSHSAGEEAHQLSPGLNNNGMTRSAQRQRRRAKQQQARALRDGSSATPSHEKHETSRQHGRHGRRTAARARQGPGFTKSRRVDPTGS